MSNLKDVIVGNTYKTNNCGDYKITKVINHRHVEIEFIITGFKKIVQASKIRTGTIKDPYFPLVYGLGYYGEGVFKANNEGKTTVEYNRWYGMFERCYDSKVHEKNPSYIGCSVSPEWYDFQTFARWFNDNKPLNVDISEYDLDKDIKVPGNKIYSPYTCTIVHFSINNSFAHSNKTTHVIRSPLGVSYPIQNVTDFAKRNGLQPSLLWKVIKGERKSHKGWTI